MTDATDNGFYVDFDFWCPRCRFSNLPGYNDPCKACMAVTHRENSSRPVKLEESNKPRHN